MRQGAIPRVVRVVRVARWEVVICVLGVEM